MRIDLVPETLQFTLEVLDTKRDVVNRWRVAIRVPVATKIPLEAVVTPLTGSPNGRAA
jgi:hypothetical protein